MRGFLLIFACFGAVLSSPVENNKCSPKYVADCIEDYEFAGIRLKDMIKDPWRIGSFDEFCRDLTKSRDCLNNALENCENHDAFPRGKDYIRSQLSNASQFEDEICTEGHQVRQRHLKHGGCIASKVSHELVDQRCLNFTRSFLSQMIPEERMNPFNFSNPEDLRILCCSTEYAWECIGNLVLSSCGEEAAKYFKEWRKDFPTIKECKEDWTYGSGECAALIPQSLVDQLGLTSDGGHATSSTASSILWFLLSLLLLQHTV